MPSVVQFDPDDSLLDVVRTPGAAEVKHANRREFIPDLASSSESLPGPSGLSPTLFAVDSAERLVFSVVAEENVLRGYAELLFFHNILSYVLRSCIEK